MAKTKKITQLFVIRIEDEYGGKHRRPVSEQEYHDWAALLNQLSAYDGKKWGAIKGMTDKYGWVEGYAVSTSQEIS